MKTINGKELNLNEVVLYKISENKGDNRMVVLVYKDYSKNPIILTESQYREYCKIKMPSNVKKLSDGSYEIKAEVESELVPYSEINEEIVLLNMKQIVKKVEKDNNIVEVTYEDDTKISFSKAREGVITYISEKQHEVKMKNDEILGRGDVVPIFEKGRPSPSESKKRAKKAYLAAALASAAILTGLYKVGTINKLENGVFELYIPLNNNDKKVNPAITELSEKLYKSAINNNNMGLLLSNEIVKFDETLAYEIVSFLNGIYPENLKDVNEETAKKELGRVEQALLLIHSSNLDPKTDEFLNLADYVINVKAAAVLNNAFVMSRYFVDEPFGKPMGTLILNSDEEKEKFVGDYEKVNSAVDKLLIYEAKSEMGCDTGTPYKNTNQYLTWAVISLFQTINSTIPADSYAKIWSETRNCMAPWPYIYYIDKDQSGKQIDIRVKIESLNINGYIEEMEMYLLRDSSCNETLMSPCEFEEYKKLNSNVEEFGIRKSLKDRIDIISQKIIGLINKNALGNLDKAKMKAFFK